MLTKFEETWKQFLESIEDNLNNFISLKYVGILLRHLAEKGQRKISRSLPRGCSERSPNLVVCKNENIWSQTLSLYLCDKSQPLPFHDEILTCSEDTSIEQVDIFLRRALFNSCGKIHTVINVDKMSLTLCEGIEQLLIKYQRDVHSDYRLVFICGSDSENRSALISSLDKYRGTVFLMEQIELCTCLLHKFQNTSQSDTISPAASVDFEK
ncbi:E3 ubiquitin-protein ligase rnf213-alpha-like [Ruditapes philippinarum]|uniref:E3 ubiquitin-protein ligase rnf213-alpha-like n=1 Tax=Ruditapes philippinarum TaxID=129788 RepID=UPI00295AF827|nr:E3 ubiquitin-protein ligase rnf213-alpha-like [Ruditapes philippinarum]